MTSISTQTHLIHDSGGWFDDHTSCGHTHIKNYLVNDNITVGGMPFTNIGDDDSTYTEEYGGNATERDVSIEISIKSEVDFDLSENSFENNDDTRDRTNEAFDYSESVCYENAKTTLCETVEAKCQSDPKGYVRIAKDIPYNCDIEGNSLDQNSRVFLVNSKVSPLTNIVSHVSNIPTHCINNNFKHFPKCQKILDSCLTVKDCNKSDIVVKGGNAHLSQENEERNVDLTIHQDIFQTDGDEIHVNDDDSFQFGEEKDADNSRENSNEVDDPTCSSSDDNKHTRDCGLYTEPSKNSVEKSVENEYIEDEENKISLKDDAKIKNIFTYNWTHSVSQSEYLDELSQTDVAIIDAADLLEDCNNSDDETAIELSAFCRSSSPDAMESEWLISPVGEMGNDTRKLSCCSISSLSSLSIAEFLLRPHSKSSTPDISLPMARRASTEGMEELSHSRRSSLSYTIYSRRSSITNAPCGVLSNLSRRSSLSGFVPSRPSSPVFEEHSLSTVTEISSKSSTYSQTSSMSIDSEPAFLFHKSSMVDRRISDASDISSISLSGIFGERESLFASTLEPMEEKERNDRPSPSPFGDQLKYFQDKKKNEMFLVKATTARLGLNTRRSSYSLWREENLDNKGRPMLMKPEINVGQKTDVFTKERVTAINMAIDWVREELLQLREQDESLARQLLDIRRTIHELKLDWSCENHREMLMEAEDEIKENKCLRRVSDLPEHHTQDCILRDKGVTRIKRGDRKYSIF